MNANHHIDNNLYKSKLKRVFSLQYVLNTVSILCLTSIFLFGTYKIFNADAAYLGGILTLVIFSIMREKVKNVSYSYLRPKINQVLFSNLFNLFNLVFSALCLVLIYINIQDASLVFEFSMLGSAIFMIGLPLGFFFWISFTRTDEKAKLMITKFDGIQEIKSYEIYFTIIIIACFGILYDFLPQTINYLLFLPLILLIIISIINFPLHKTQHKLIVKFTETIKRDLKKENENLSLFNVYEKNPYQLSELLREKFLEASLKEKYYILYTIKRISAIDEIGSIELLIEKTDSSDEIYDTLVEINQYLKRIKEEIEEIKNPYEYIEQSNDLPIIKGLIRNQIISPDRNFIIKLLNDNRLSVKKPACVVAGYQDDINIISILIEHLEKPELSLWAQLALENIGEKCLKYIEIEFSKRKENLLFVESSFALLCRINNEAAYQILFKSLNETNSNIRKIAAKKIIINNIEVTEKNRKYFAKLFDELILTILSNGYLIEQMELKNENFKILKNAIENENKEALYIIINIVKLYYNPVAIEEIFRNYKNNNVESNAVANCLIDLVINDNLSVHNKIKTLFSPREKVLLEVLQEEFPEITLQPNYETEEKLIWGILNKEYDQINSWTRACTINILQYAYKEDIPFELASEFLNQNKLLKETAAVNIYKNLPEFYTIFLKRLPANQATKLDYLIRSNLDVVNQKQIHHDNLLLFDKINFLISIPYLNYLSVSEILNFHKYFQPKVLEAGEHQISLKEEFNLGYWIVEHGNASYSKNGIDFNQFKKRDIIKVSDHESPTENVFFYLEEDVRFLVVDEVILLNIIKNYESIIQKYLEELPDRNTNQKKLKKEAA
ncbi:hypothetical protein QYS49_38015 [Marivirga salinae]|uniref:Cyclic nucleotide-binding domain-containing protein n=1 Tax=Marivirga salinarum TaxID=3059078 RepID=A0AA51NA25_9BACT|nr:hypothetical protein [Marivirga sp. BDSF4-3]WMN11338.1 hypothetical protein QYS49_38015 [Marivirga sp. BDSF4-3]